MSDEAYYEAEAQEQARWGKYQRKGLSEMRSYQPGEDLSKISVSAEDTPEEGGMIARNPKNHDDQWYVAKAYFDDNLEEAGVIARNGSLSFGDAISALKKGKRVRRSGWNGNGMWIFRQVPASISTDIIPNMQSLPDSAKATFEERGSPLVYENQLALVTPSGDINGWSPSVADALADDWEIIE